MPAPLNGLVPGRIRKDFVKERPRYTLVFRAKGNQIDAAVFARPIAGQISLFFLLEGTDELRLSWVEFSMLVDFLKFVSQEHPELNAR